MEVVDKRRVDENGESKQAPRIGRTIAGSRPAFDRVLVKLIELENTSSIVTADAFQEPTDIGEVVMVGDGVYLGGVWVDIPFKVGDVIRFGNLSREGAEFDESGEYAFVRAQDVRCYWPKNV